MAKRRAKGKMPAARKVEKKDTPGERELSMKEWMRASYLKYWFWLGAIVLIFVIMGSIKPFMPHGSFLIASVVVLVAVLAGAGKVYRRLWPPGPDDIPEF